MICKFNKNLHRLYSDFVIWYFDSFQSYCSIPNLWKLLSVKMNQYIITDFSAYNCNISEYLISVIIHTDSFLEVMISTDSAENRNF